MADEVQSKVALVTGGNRGIGKEIAFALARAGTDVVITYRPNEEEVPSVAEDIRRIGRRSAALRLDLMQMADLDGFIDACGALLARHFGTSQLDNLISNAGFGKAIPIEKLTFEDFDKFNNVHFKGVVFLTQKALGMMRDNGGVVFITAAGDRYNVPGYAAYAAKAQSRCSRAMSPRNMARAGSGRTAWLRAGS